MTYDLSKDPREFYYCAGRFSLLKDIADMVLPKPVYIPWMLGKLELAEHQAFAVYFLLHTISVTNGGILADATGFGKTRTALAIVSLFSQKPRESTERFRVWLIVPSRLREKWERYVEAAIGDLDLEVTLVSHYQVSCGKIPDGRPDFVLVDEAHHFRNRRTKRYQNLRPYTQQAPTLLITATPIANNVAELVDMIRLFNDDLQVRATTGHDLTTLMYRRDDPYVEYLSNLIVRRTDLTHGFLQMPQIDVHLLYYEPSAEEASFAGRLDGVLESLDLPQIYAWWPKGLFKESVIRLFDIHPSTPIPMFELLLDSLMDLLSSAAGNETITVKTDDLRFLMSVHRRYPYQLQLPFARHRIEYDEDLLSPNTIQLTRDELQAQLASVESLLEELKSASSEDAQTEAIFSFTDSCDESVLIFTSSVIYARALYQAYLVQRPTEQVALVTGQEARIAQYRASGPQEVLDRFTFYDNVDGGVRVLIATDCLSEGVEFPTCAQMIMTDLPYSTLTIEQRIGRISRLSSQSDLVFVHVLRRKGWTDPLELQNRLRDKYNQSALGHVPLTKTATLLDVIDDEFDEEPPIGIAHDVDDLLSAVAYRNSLLIPHVITKRHYTEGTLSSECSPELEPKDLWSEIARAREKEVCLGQSPVKTVRTWFHVQVYPDLINFFANQVNEAWLFVEWYNQPVYSKTKAYRLDRADGKVVTSWANLIKPFRNAYFCDDSKCVKAQYYMPEPYETLIECIEEFEFSTEAQRMFERLMERATDDMRAVNAARIAPGGDCGATPVTMKSCIGVFFETNLERTR